MSVLKCPKCGGRRIESVETMTKHYMLRRVWRNEQNELQYEYTGDYRDFDETATPTGKAWCTECNHEFSLARLFPKRQRKTT